MQNELHEKAIEWANIEWRNQMPFSLDFDDIYYSSDNGLAETEHVFIQHNQLIERFSKLAKPEFCIIETGFGTGLNFLCAAQHWLAHAPTKATLKFISIERYPLKIEDLIKANQQWSQFSEIAKQLNKTYSQLSTGVNVFLLCQNRIHFKLWIDDVSKCLPKIQTSADAWFLDGFAPVKNNAMWSKKLFNTMARLSKTNTTFATFTSAGLVKRQLQEAGFTVNKASGYGKKREMLYGVYD